MIQVATGSGARSGRLYDLWRSNGKPERIGYAATNGYVDAGLRFVATAATFCAGGTLGLHEVGGRLYGRWCGVEGIPLRPSIWIPGRAEQRVDFHSIPATPHGNPFGEPATLVIWGSIGTQANYPAGYWGRQQNGTWPYYEWSGAVPAGFVSSIGGGPGGSVTGYWTLPARAGYFTFQDSLLNLGRLDEITSSVVAVSVLMGVPWITAGAWSRSGEWVRRKSWSDLNMMIRHEAGPGSVRAVAVFKSSSVTAAHPVRNAEFGVAEFLAQDWVLKYPPTGDIDLTDAMIAVDAALWVLWKSSAPTVPDDGGLLPPGGGTGGTTGSSCCGCP